MSRLSNIVARLKNNSGAKYLLAGATAFGADYILLVTTYYIVGLPLKIATSIGFFSGFLISFSLNRRWVFWGDRHKKLSRQVIEYVILLIFNYLFTVWAVSFLNTHGIKPAIGKLGVMGLIVCWNYALFRWVIFAQQSPTD